ncbi:MAG: hypothetical protein KA362_12575, partial [Chloroflexi bacterium]|nr:hypothetical protein [Chloroflexota bacterium]
MIKRIALGLLFVLFSGALVVGAANRTAAKTDKVAETAVTNPAAAAERLHENAPADTGPVNGQGQGADLASTAAETAVTQGQGQGNGRGAANNGLAADATTDCPDGGCLTDGSAAQNGASGAGNANGRGQQQQAQDGSQTAVQPVEIVTYTGTIFQAPDYGIDLILQTETEQITIGTGPGYLTDQGVQLAIGDTLQVVGFWENGEFKANTLTRLSDGLTITLR